MSYQRCVIFLLSLTLWAGPLRAQTPATDPLADQSTTKPTPQSTKEEQEKVRQQAVKLLGEVADEAGQMRIPQNRIFFLTIAANLMWDQDEKSARNMFQIAMADMRSLYMVNGADDDVNKTYRRRSEAGSLRQTLLLSLARHDPKMARTFLRETHELATGGGTEAYGPYGNDDQLELTLALQIALNDPDQALEIGRQTLAKGFSIQIVRLAETIFKKNPDTAAKLTGDVITKLKTTNLAENSEAAALAVALFQKGLPPAPTKNKNGDKSATAMLDESAMRDLAEMITAAALNAPPANYNLSSIRNLLGQLEKYAPARVKQLRRKLGAASEPGAAEGNMWAELNRLREDGTADELIQAAEKPETAANHGMYGMYYDAAVTKLIAAGDLDKARAAAEKASDPEVKKRLTAAVEQAALEQAATKGNLDESRRLLSNVKTNEERIMALTALATAVSAKDKKAALLLLEEASNLSVVRPRNFRQMFARLALVRAYAPLDPDQSFNILESSVDQANELLAALFMLGEFIAEDEVVRDDEVAMFQLSGSVDSEVQQYRPTVSALAQADFKRMEGVADRFQRPEIRLLARLLIAQSVLSSDTDADGPDLAPPVASNTDVD